jgi:hypothetical protein
MLSTPAAQLALNSGMAMCSVVDTFNPETPDDDDANYQCDLCDKVDRENGLDRLITAFQIASQPTGDQPGRLSIYPAKGRSMTQLMLEELTGPRIVLVLYMCHDCAAVLKAELDPEEMTEF